MLARSGNHLKRLFPTPREGETVPIQFIDMQEKLAGWSPQLKRSIYVDDFKDTEDLKRVREVTLLKVYNCLIDGESFIELSEMEKKQFEKVMDMFIIHGGEILFTRRKCGGRIVNYFILDDSLKSRAKITKKQLNELLGQNTENGK